MWKKLRAEEAYRRKVELDRLRTQQDQAAIAESLKAAESEHQKAISAATPPPPAPGFFHRHRQPLAIGVAFVLFAVLTRSAVARHRQEAQIRALSGGYLSDGTEVAKFQMPDWFAPPAPETNPGMTESDNAGVTAQSTSVEALYEAALLEINSIRELLRELNKAEGDQRQAGLTKLLTLTTSLVKQANNWSLRPVWQIASALELLVKRTVEKPKDASPSVLRTIALAVDTLRDVCAPGVRPNLLMEPPIKVLAADDDALCRRAVAFALEKASLAADLAEDGLKAVTLATDHAYDIVFMDIQMPEMDGLTACARIRETKVNAHTPVVFVTIQSDFQTRVQTAATGGSDFIAKPFLVFELTVKAVVSAARKRLLAEQNAAQASSASPVVAPKIDQAKASEAVEVAPRAETAAQASPAQPFLELAATHLTEARDLVEQVNGSATPAEQTAKLASLHLHIQTVAAQARLNQLEFAARAAAGAEALVHKLHQNVKFVTPSSLNTLRHVLDLLAELCDGETAKRLSGRGPIRLLVVEDEPLARRAVVGALQLAFEKPDSANDGVAALAMAMQHAYDVIFTDIQMPGMDGFELCRKVRAEGPNQNTPVVFITSHTDFDSQNQASESGGTEFLGKPFLPIEITVKALTLALRHRLR